MDVCTLKCTLRCTKTGRNIVNHLFGPFKKPIIALCHEKKDLDKIHMRGGHG